jgi:hypothetical protein
MEESLIGYLKAASGITALLGTNPVRIYWTLAPQNVAKPYATLQRISGNRDTHMKGVSGLVESRVQVDCYGLTYAASKGVARAVEARISGGAFTQSGTAFRVCLLDTERDGYEDGATPDKLFRTSLDFIIWHKGA